MTISPDVVLSFVGAILLLIAFTGGLKWGGMSIAEATGLKARIASGLCGAVCLSLSVYLYISPLAFDTANATPQTRDTIDASYMPHTPDPAPPLQEDLPSPDGTWNITMESRYQIIWEMTITTQGDIFNARGSKLFVNGQPATHGERNTILEFTGTIKDLKVNGHYTETQSDREVNGRIEITFSKDHESLTGIIHHPGGQTGSNFTGHKAKSPFQ